MGGPDGLVELCAYPFAFVGLKGEPEGAAEAPPFRVFDGQAEAAAELACLFGLWLRGRSWPAEATGYRVYRARDVLDALAPLEGLARGILEGPCVRGGPSSEACPVRDGWAAWDLGVDWPAARLEGGEERPYRPMVGRGAGNVKDAGARQRAAPGGGNEHIVDAVPGDAPVSACVLVRPAVRQGVLGETRGRHHA